MCVHTNPHPQLCGDFFFFLITLYGRGQESEMVNPVNLSLRFSELLVCYADELFILISATVYSC